MWTRVTTSFWVGTTRSVTSQLLRIVPSIAASNLHVLYDRHDWLLLPEDHILEKYYNESLLHAGNVFYAKRECFPQFSVRLISCLIMTWFFSKLSNIRRKHFFINLCHWKTWKRRWSRAEMMLVLDSDSRRMSPVISIHSTICHFSKAIFTLNSLFMIAVANWQSKGMDFLRQRLLRISPAYQWSRLCMPPGS